MKPLMAALAVLAQVLVLPVLSAPFISPPADLDTALTITNGARAANVRLASNGQGTLVAWRDARSGYEDVYCAGLSVEGRLQDPDGVPVTKTAGREENLVLAGNGQAYLVVWETEQPPAGLYARRVDGAGKPLDDVVISLAPRSGSHELKPAVASDGTNYVVVWQSFDEAVGTHDILVRRVLADGTLPEVAVPLATGPMGQVLPAVAGMATGYLVVWEQYAVPGPAATLRAMRLRNDATRLDADSFPVATTPGSQANAVVTASEDTFLVAWENRNPVGSAPNVSAARVRADGTVVDTEPLVVRADGLAKAQIAAASDGTDFLLTWLNRPTDPPPINQNIEGAHITSTGQVLALSGDVLFPSVAAETLPAVAFDGQAYVVAWQVNSAIQAIRLTSQGASASVIPELVAGRLNKQTLPVVARTSDGFIAAWVDNRLGGTQTNALYIAGYSAAGQPRFEPRRVSLRARPPVHVALAVSGEQALLVWLEQNAGDNRPRTLALRLRTSDGTPMQDSVPRVLFDPGGSEDLRLIGGPTGWLMVDTVSVGSPPALQIRAFRFADDGTLLDRAGILLSTTTGFQAVGNPAVAFNGTNYLVVWRDNQGPSGIYGGRLTPQGQVMELGGVRISVNSDREMRHPAVASNGGDYYVAWQDMPPFTGTSQPYTIRGTVVSGDLQVAIPGGLALRTGSNQEFPVVAGTGTGYLITWEHSRPIDSITTFDLAGVRISAAGNVVDVPRLVFAGETENEQRPSLAVNGGTAFLAYQARNAVGDYRARRVLISDSQPQVQATAGGGVHVVGGAPTLMVPDARFVDADNDTYANGQITIAVEAGTPSQTRLVLTPNPGPTDAFQLVGNEVRGDGGLIGMLDTSNPQSLTVQVSAPVPQSLVEAILRHLAAEVPGELADGGPTSIRVVLTVTDPDGHASAPFRTSVALARAPMIVEPPLGVIVRVGSLAEFQVAATGGNLSYTWMFNGIPLVTSKSPTLRLTGVFPVRVGAYSVRVSNAAGSVTSPAVSLTVEPDLPAILSLPGDQTVVQGRPAFLPVIATANLPLGFQWLKDGKVLPGATKSALEFPAVTLADDAFYRLIVSNASASATSAPIHLTVVPDVTPPVVVGARTWGNTNRVVVVFSEPLDRASAELTNKYRLDPPVAISAAFLDPADVRQVFLTTATLNPAASYTLTVTNVTDRASNALVGNVSVPVDRTVVTQSLLGGAVAGFQDDFSAPDLDTRWIAVGAGGPGYARRDGILTVTAQDGDPNHLLFAVPGYSTTTQDVLARIRILRMEVGDGPRGGVAAATDPASSQGIDLHFRRESAGRTHFELLDDLRAWGPETSVTWRTNEWFWLRLHHEPDVTRQKEDVFSRMWLADGATPEPASWQRWDTGTANPPRSGFAGIAGSSNGGSAEFEVDYILIAAPGLPAITVQPTAFVPSLEIGSMATDGSIRFLASGMAGVKAYLQSSGDLENWTDVAQVSLAVEAVEVNVPPAAESPELFYRVIIR